MLVVNVTFAVDEKTKQRMDNFRDINWSAVARTAVEKRVGELEFLENVTKHSELTELDAVQLGKKIKASLVKIVRS